MIEGFKAFNRNLQCRGFQYKEGKTYELKDDPVCCSHGFHFSKEIALTLEFYPVSTCVTENLYAKIEAIGKTVFEDITQHKGCTNKIKIVKVYSDAEILKMFDKKNNTGNGNTGNDNTGNDNTGKRNTGNGNTGDRNTGDGNTGYRNTGNRNTGNGNTGYRNTGNGNTGDRNTGDGNTGDRNTGSRNTGDFNIINYESGFFNSVQVKTIRVFNKNCTIKKWENCDKPNFIYFDLIAGKTYKESFQEAFKNASEEDIKLLRKLPNFSEKVFFDISGIKLPKVKK